MSVEVSGLGRPFKVCFSILRVSPRRALEFDDYPDDKPDFVKYAVELCCLNPVVDTKKTPLPPMEDLAEAVTLLLQVGLHQNKEPRKELKKYYTRRGPRRSGFRRHKAPAHGTCGSMRTSEQEG
jgi:hypothetical protein